MSIRVCFKNEGEYIPWVWEQYTKGNKIHQIIHLTNRVRIVIEIFGEFLQNVIKEERTVKIYSKSMKVF